MPRINIEKTDLRLNPNKPIEWIFALESIRSNPQLYLEHYRGSLEDFLLAMTAAFMRSGHLEEMNQLFAAEVEKTKAHLTASV
jgi:hypothetical protein